MNRQPRSELEATPSQHFAIIWPYGVVTYHENGVHMNNNVLTRLREEYRRRGEDLKRNKDGTYRVVERNVFGTGKVLIPHNNVENRSTLTDNRQRRSGCERTNRSYLNYSNMPKQLAKQSACACISTEPHPGRLRPLPFGRLASIGSNQFLPGI
jgi:hypothetical protein